MQMAEMGQDLGSSRGLQKQHSQLEAESQALASKMAALVPKAHQAVSSQAIVEETGHYRPAPIRGCAFTEAEKYHLTRLIITFLPRSKHLLIS